MVNILPEIGESKSFKCLNVDKNTITILEKPSGSWMCSLWVRDASIKRISDNVIQINGTKFDKSCTWGKTFISDFHNQKNLPKKQYLEYGFKNIIDRFLKKKSPYVNGWYEYSNPISYECIISHFIIKKDGK